MQQQSNLIRACVRRDIATTCEQMLLMAAMTAAVTVIIVDGGYDGGYDGGCDGHHCDGGCIIFGCHWSSASGCNSLHAWRSGDGESSNAIGCTRSYSTSNVSIASSASISNVSNVYSRISNVSRSRRSRISKASSVASTG